jgi:hypothetical protein
VRGGVGVRFADRLKISNQLLIMRRFYDDDYPLVEYYDQSGDEPIFTVERSEGQYISDTCIIVIWRL